jgi:hypothetical protein
MHIWKGLIAWMYVESRRISSINELDVWNSDPSIIVELLRSDKDFHFWLKANEIEWILSGLGMDFSAEDMQDAKLAYDSLCSNKP